jgi:hypothetical protein
VGVVTRHGGWQPTPSSCCEFGRRSADTCISVGRHYAAMAGRDYTDTADDFACRVQGKIGTEPAYYRNWRSLGLDPADMERRAEELRVRLHQEHPEMGWRERMHAVYKMWDEIDAPLSEAKRAKRAAARAAKKAEQAKNGQLGLKS